jgi:N-methylhydantoinase A
VPVTEQEIATMDTESIRLRFNEVHDRRFGHAAEDEPVEVVNLRLTSRGARPKINFPRLTGTAADAQIGTRDIYLDDPHTPVECAVYSRELLAPGVRVSGPCVIEEYASTTVMFAGDEALVADTGELLIDVARA